MREIKKREIKKYTQRLAANVKGKWYKASGYVWHGATIAPAPGASFEVIDPWNEHQNCLPKHKQRLAGVIDRPYLSLLNLGWRTLSQTEPGSTFRLSQNGNDMVFRWVEKKGLLGILLAESQCIILPGSLPQTLLVPSTQFQWDETKCDTIGFPDLFRRGAVVRRKPRDIFSEHKPTISFESASSVSAFFPNSDPLKDERCWRENFQRDYGEPAEAIALTAISFGVLAVEISKPKNQSDFAFDYLVNLAGGGAPAFALANGRLTYEHNSPSLLCSYALMLLWDIMDGLTVAKCQSCEAPFVRHSTKVHYCGSQCQQREKMNRYNAKKRATDQTKKSTEGDS